MTKKANTKRALIVSCLSMLLCVTMLIGSTFAWFTDTASTNVNTIEAGTLKIKLVDKDGQDVQNRSLGFLKPDGSVYAANEMLWEPGCTFQLEPVYIVSEGSLALKYMVEIYGFEGSKKLNEVIEWTIDYGYGENNTEGHLASFAKSAPIRISGHMKEEAGNDYQGLSLSGVTILVRATQDAVEHDSNSNAYDAGAQYDKTAVPTTPGEGGGEETPDYPFDLNKENKTITVYRASDFAMLAEGAEKFGLGVNDYPDQYTVKLGNDINYGSDTLDQPIKAWWSYFDGQGYTLSNVQVKTSAKWAGLFMPGSSENTLAVKNLKLNNISVTASAEDSYAGVVTGYSANATLENIAVTNSTVTGTKYSGGIIGQAGSSHLIGCSVSNSSIVGTRIGGIVGDAFCEGGSASIKNCSVDFVTLTNTDPANGTSGTIAGRVRNDDLIAKENNTATNVTGADKLYGGQSTLVNIGTAAELADLAANPKNYQGKTIKLTADIDLSGTAWTPIYAWDGVLNGTVIDGQGYAIKNMKVENGDAVGFISANASSLTLKNLVFENAYVKASDGNGTYAGVVVGKNYSSVILDNVSVTNSQVRCNWQAGGLVGFAENNAPVFQNCTISDSFVGGSNCTAGAFFGLGVVDITVTGGRATNVDLYTDMEAGLVAYLYGKTLTNNGCTVTDVTVVSQYPA